MSIPATRFRHLSRGATALAVLALPASLAFADSEDSSFSLRFPAALSRFAGYGDVAAVGGASAASRWQSSINPASAAWTDIPTDFKISASPQFSYIDFAHGSDFMVYTESVTWQTDFGTFEPAAAQIRTRGDATRLGPDLEFSANYFQLQWGFRPAADSRWAIGANVNYTDSHLAFVQDGLDLSATSQNSFDFRGGVLYDVIPDKLRAGLVADYGFAPLRTSTFVAPGSPNFKHEDTAQQVLVRPGIAWEYANHGEQDGAKQNRSAIYADYQFAFFTDDTGDLWLHRFDVGIDHQLLPDSNVLFVRAGTALDTDGHASFTAGFAFYPSKHVGIDVAYQYDMFPELHHELGRSQTLTVSLGISF